jgi:hypothetical protein
MKTIKALIGLGVMCAAIYVGWSLIPPYFGHYKLDDIVEDQARLNTYTNKSEEQIRDAVFDKAKESDIPITREQILVTRAGQSISINVSYSVHLDFPIHPVDLQFHSETRNRGF